MSAVLMLPSPTVSVERKCSIEEVFDQSFIELLRIVPANPFIRALILKLTGKMPESECETFEQIREWVETTCEKRKSIPVRPVRRAAEGGISIRVEFSETEYGRADYSVRRYGSDLFHVDAADLIEIIRSAIDAEEGIDQVVDIIAEKVDDDAWNQCEPSMDTYGDYDYDDFDANDTGDSETEFSKSQIRDSVLVFLRERHPGLAAELLERRV